MRTRFKVDVKGCAASLLAGPLQGEDLGVLDPLKSVGAQTDYSAFAIHNDGTHAGIRRS
jgi:hypothetical protein